MSSIWNIRLGAKRRLEPLVTLFSRESWKAGPTSHRTETGAFGKSKASKRLSGVWSVRFGGTLDL